eukprot:jgi/Chlat1/2449/Chrsp171S02337
MYQVRELCDAPTIIFTGSPERAHVAAYLCGFAIISYNNASHNYIYKKDTRKDFVTIGTNKMYFSVDDHMKRWTDAVLQGLDIVIPSDRSMTVKPLDKLPGAAVPPLLGA